MEPQKIKPFIKTFRVNKTVTDTSWVYNGEKLDGWELAIKLVSDGWSIPEMKDLYLSNGRGWDIDAVDNFILENNIKKRKNK